MKKPKLNDSPDLRERIYFSILQGVSVSDLANELNVTQVTLYKYLKTNNIPFRNEFPRGLTEEIVSLVIAYIKQHPNADCKAIRKKFNLTDYKLKWIIRYGGLNKWELKKEHAEPTQLQEEIIVRYTSGEYASMAAIARDLGVTRAHVSKTIQRHKEGA